MYEERIPRRNRHHYRELTPIDFDKNISRRRLLSSSVIVPSLYNSYSICTEFAREWILEKFDKDFFTHVHIDGKLGFDDLRRFDSPDKKVKRVNPLLAIIPSITDDHSRDWIDVNIEGPLQHLRRTRMEGTFFSDHDRELFIAVQFKTILMNFTYKMRVNTRAEQLDLMDFIKTNCKSGLTDTKNIDLDIHIPKEIIAQLACDVGFTIDNNLNVQQPYELLNYMNSNSILPILYKFRCSNGNNEFFTRVLNTPVNIKIEMPSKDDGERSGVDSTNYTVEFSTEFEMLAPLNYIYYSVHEQPFIKGRPTFGNNIVTVMKHVKTDIPPKSKKGWDLVMTTEYVVEKEDLGKPIDINFMDLFAGIDLKMVVDYTLNNLISPEVFIDFRLFRDGYQINHDIDWNTMICRTSGFTHSLSTIIAVYMDKRYVNDVLTNLKGLNGGRIN